LKTKISALHIPHNKNTASMNAVAISAPAEVLLPMNMHGGAPAVPVVAVGDYVRVGQMVAKEEGRNSVPVHATISGTVTAVEEMKISGATTTVIRIAGDGKMEKDPSLTPKNPENLDEFLTVLRDSGIVGLGGAAFPLWAKLDAARKNHIKTVLVNGAECEPYITSDHRTMVENADLVVRGVQILKKFLESEEFVIGIEDNKPDAIAKLKELFKDMPYVNVKPLKAVYPQGAKQVLLYNAAGLVAKEGQRLASLGVIIINVTTLAKMALYMDTGMPLVDKIVTVDGAAVAEPKNLIVPIGTPIQNLIDECGGLKGDVGKIIIGGPMMGKTTDSLESPVIKACNALLVFDKEASKALEPSACIHCGRCVDACPLNLNPTAYSKAMEIEDEELRYQILTEENVSMCMACGCCAYVCPAHKPLVTTNNQAKSFVRKMKAAKEPRKEGAK